MDCSVTRTASVMRSISAALLTMRISRNADMAGTSSRCGSRSFNRSARAGIQAPFVVTEPAPVKARVLQRPDDAFEEVLHRLQVDADLADALFAGGERPVVFHHTEEGAVGDYPGRRHGVHHIVHLAPGNHEPRRGHRVPGDDGGDVLPAPHPAQVEDVGNIGGGEQAVEVPLGQNPLRPRFIDPHVKAPWDGKWRCCESTEYREPNRGCQTRLAVVTPRWFQYHPARILLK